MDIGDGDAMKEGNKVIAHAYKNHLYVPLDFELLASHMPFYQSRLGDRLDYKLTVKDSKDDRTSLHDRQYLPGV